MGSNPVGGASQFPTSSGRLLAVIGPTVGRVIIGRWARCGPMSADSMASDSRWAMEGR